MIYYIIGLHSELALLLLEWKSPSLIQLFEDAREVEENIHASRRIRGQDFFENRISKHIHFSKYKYETDQYILDSEQKSSEYEVDKEQQPEGEYISDSELDSSVLAEYSRDRYACEVYDQFVNQEDPMMTDDCIRNYMFLVDPNPCDGNLVLSSSCENYSDKEIVIFDDHELMSRGTRR
jgi:hypothetical protein